MTDASLQGITNNGVTLELDKDLLKKSEEIFYNFLR